MNDEARDRLAALEEELELEKKNYWNELIAANDPDAVAKHDALCADGDRIIRSVRRNCEALEALFEHTRQTMINVSIAHYQGDHDEMDQLAAEFDDPSSSD